MTGPDAHGEDVGLEGAHHVVAPPGGSGGVHQRGHGRRGGERDRIDPVVGDLVDQPEHRGRVLRAHHPVDGDDVDDGPLPAQGVRDHRQRLAVLLDHDPASGQVPPAQVVEHVLEELGLRRPQLAQPGAAQRPDALGPARQDLGRPQRRDQVLAQSPAVGGREPGLHPHARGGQEQVGRLGHDRLGGAAQGGVVDPGRAGRQRGRPHDLRTPALDERDLLIGLARGGHADPEAREAPPPSGPVPLIVSSVLTIGAPCGSLAGHCGSRSGRRRPTCTSPSTTRVS